MSPYAVVLLLIGVGGGVPLPLGLAEFRAGGAVEAPVGVMAGTVRIDGPDGPVQFPRDGFRRIVLPHPIEASWAQRRELLVTGTRDEQLEALRWAVAHGLIEQAKTEARAQGLLTGTLDRLQVASLAPEARSLLARLPDGSWKTTEGPHVLLIHQATTGEADERIGLLESVFEAFYLDFALGGVELQFPDRKLVHVWFPDRSGYRAYLDSQGAGEFRATRGYFHPVSTIVATYDLRSDPGFRRRGTAIGPASSPQTDRLRLLLALERDALERGTAAHELIHQLVRSSGLAPRHECFPDWLHEGLAMQYEPMRGGRFAGSASVNTLRLSDWRATQPAPTLHSVVRGERLTNEAGYAAAWALVFLLRQSQPERFQAMLDRLKVPGPDLASPTERGERAFQAVFGTDLDQLRQEWLRLRLGPRPGSDSQSW